MSERSYDGAKTFFPFRSYDPSHNRRTHWAISRSNQFSTPGITEAMLYAILFYLTTHTTSNLRSDGVRYTVKDHLYESGNPLAPLHSLHLSISSKGVLHCTIQQTGWDVTHQLWSGTSNSLVSSSETKCRMMLGETNIYCWSLVSARVDFDPPGSI